MSSNSSRPGVCNTLLNLDYYFAYHFSFTDLAFLAYDILCIHIKGYLTDVSTPRTIK